MLQHPRSHPAEHRNATDRCHDAFSVGRIILFESTLSFLGFGIVPPTPTWGNMPDQRTAADHLGADARRLPGPSHLRHGHGGEFRRRRGRILPSTTRGDRFRVALTKRGKRTQEEMKSVKSVPVSFAKVVLAVAVIAAAGSSAATAQSNKSQLVVGQLQFLTNFHPLVQVNNTKRLVVNYSLRPMTAFNENVENQCILCETLPTIENGLAKIVDMPDGKKGMKVTLALKKGLAWATSCRYRRRTSNLPGRWDAIRRSDFPTTMRGTAPRNWRSSTTGPSF